MGSFSWLAIGNNINLANFVPLEVLEARVIPNLNFRLSIIKQSCPPRGELFFDVANISATST